MAPKIFLTGVTGYVGGDIFANLYETHPDWDYTVIVRNQDRGIPVAAKYPSVKIVYGDLDASDVLSAASAEADIVVHAANSDHPGSAKAITKGIAQGHTADKPGYLIFVSGTGLLMYHDQKNKRYGQPPAEGDEYEDMGGVEKILALPEDALHRDVEMIVQAADSDSVRTAVYAPCMIYGPGRGPVNTRSMQVYDLAKYTLTHGFAPIVETGKTEWDQVHVHDMSDVVLLLTEAALDPKKAKDPQFFGDHAYYFAENGPIVWGELSELIAKEAHKQGYLQEPKAETIDFQTVVAQMPGGATWALNSKSHATRARKLLGWKPTRRGVKEEIPDIVAGEAKRLGLTPKYAK
ncbi:NAD(P)-binding protein [Coniochaeta ligniaria NRRL 30616]|uniref:NAD(P)-binding protein n=1 Tax=Coniochaeta ligniaria NRRL 30616 TaxID=1408157 RepID=A0A1J7J8K9_9PEZI|nr:NAD(P)-binding protein [Coniochaeta ligniaria NRRL 30616]